MLDGFEEYPIPHCPPGDGKKLLRAEVLQEYIPAEITCVFHSIFAQSALAPVTFFPVEFP
jgi:hypothetical protein